MNQRLHAGFYLRGIREAALTSGRLDASQLDAAWQRACMTDVETSIDLSQKKLPDDPVLLAASNILARGLPTLPSLALERRFADAFHRTALQDDGRGRVLSVPSSADPAFASLLVDALLSAAPLPSAATKAATDAKTPPPATDAASTLLGTEAGPEALQLLLSPLAAARLARALLSAVLAGALDLAAPAWTICVIERDVPCAALAIGEFERLLSTLLTLEGSGRSLPRCSLHVRPAPPFAASPLHAAKAVTLLGKDAALPSCDLLVDIAVLQGTKGSATAAAASSAPRMVLRSPVAPENGPSRELLFGEFRPFPGVYGKDASAPEQGKLAALRDFIADCFRITHPTGEQLRLLDMVLRCRPFLAALPSGSGKTLASHAAMLLFPASSVFVTPLASLVEEQQEQLRDVGIDAVSCLHEGMGVEERQQMREAVAGKQSLLLVLSAATFDTVDMDTLFERLRSDKLPAVQCVIDEAHTMSEWSHDFRIGMSGAPAFFAPRLEAGKKQKVAFRLLTSCASRDVVTDLRAQLADGGCILSEDEQVIVANVPRPWQHFSCERVGSTPTSAAETLRHRQTMLPELLRRQDAAVAALAGDAHAHPTVLYAPFASGLLGVTNQYDPGESDAAIDQTLTAAGLSPLLFIGKEDGFAQVGRQIIIDSSRQRRLFREGAGSLLVATAAYGIGTHKRDIRATVHPLPPTSVGRLLQECGRGGQDGQPTLHSVLFGGGADDTRSPDLLPGYDPLPDVHRITGYQHLSALAGDAAREMQITHDLLREITYPEDSNCDRIAAMIKAEFGLDLRISYWQRGLDERMYVHQGNSAMGYVDLVTQQRSLDSGYPDGDIAERVLAYAHHFALEEAGSEHGLSAWIAATFPSDVDDGLQRQLQDFDPGVEFTLRIGFENDRETLLTQVHQLLWRQAEIEIPRKLLSGIHASTWLAFRRELCRRSGDDTLFDGLDTNIERRLLQVYNRIRLREDTERFMLRLRQLGLLRYHLVHPTSRRISLRLVSRADYEILESLERVFAQRLPYGQARAALERLERYPGESVLERALQLLIDHVVTTTRERAAARAGTMLRLCALGAAEGSAAFREAITRAETARFALPWHLPELLPRHADRLRLLDETVALLQHVHDGSVLENAAHLAASCDLLKPSLPGEAGLELLRSFSRLLLADSRAIKDARQQFAAAFAAAASVSGLEGERYLAAIDEREALFRRMFGDEDTPFLLSLLHDEVKRVKAKPLPAPTIVARHVEGAVPPVRTPMAGKSEGSASLAPQSAPQNADKDQVSAQKATADKAAAEKAAAEKAAAAKAAAEKAAAEKAAAEKAAAEKAAAEKAAAEKAAAAKAAAEKAAAAKAAAEKAAAERRSKTSREGEEQREQSRANRLAHLDRSSPATEDTILAELESMLTEHDDAGRRGKASPAKAGPPASAKAGQRTASSDASVKTPVTKEERADPELLRHLQWLKAFNNNFLKHYES